jgi:hypothetical protein
VAEWDDNLDVASEPDDDPLDDPHDNPLPLSNPPASHRLHTHKYDHLDQLMEELHEWAAQAGFGIRKKRSANYVKDFGRTRIDISCARDAIRVSRAHGSRQTSTTKCGCPWAATAKALAQDNRKWSLEIRPGFDCHQNHLPAGSREDIRSLRKFRPDHIAFIATYADKPNIQAREIAAQLREQFPGIIFTRQDLWNARYQLRKASSQGYTPMQAAIKDLDNRNVRYEIRYSTEEPDKPEGLFWSDPWCEEQWVKYPWVQMYDNTYNTNNKRLAFFQIVGVNHFGLAFSCAFGLINNERQDGFNWLADMVNLHRQKINAKPPQVTITDYDKAMKTALARVYPHAIPQLCMFHVNKNVVLHIKRKWDKQVVRRLIAEGRLVGGQEQAQDEELDEKSVGEDDLGVVNRMNRLLEESGRRQRLPLTVEYSRAGLYTLWEFVIRSTTVDDFRDAYTALTTHFADQTAILKYLEDTWMPVVQQWATCYVNKVLNFGQRTTSPVEAVNRYLKSFVVTGNSTVEQVVTQAFNMVGEMKVSFMEQHSKQTTRLKYDYLGQLWLGETPLQVSWKAMKLVEKQHQIVSGWLPSARQLNPPDPTPCTSRFTTQYGIPCSHTLLLFHNNKRALTKADFHPFWWLDRSLADEDAYLRIQEPDRVEVLRGRPRNSAPFVSDLQAPLSTAPELATAVTTITVTATATTLQSHSPTPEPATTITITATASQSPTPEPVTTITVTATTSQSPSPEPTATMTVTATATISRASTACLPTHQHPIKPSIRRKRSEWEGIDLAREDCIDQGPQGKRRTVNNLQPLLLLSEHPLANQTVTRSGRVAKKTQKAMEAD